MAKDPKNKKHFFKDFKAELKKVIWPTPKQLVNGTIAVVVIVLIASAIVFVLDFAFDGMNKYGLDKLKASLRNETSITETVENEVVEDEDAADAEAEIEVEENNE